MNWDQVEGKWKQLKGSFKDKWGKATDDELTRLGGKKDQLVGHLQEKYGRSRDQAEKDLEEWRKGLKDDQIRTSGSY